MNTHDDAAFEEALADHLLAYDEALAQGETGQTEESADPTVLRERLERGLACVQLLQRLRPSYDPSRSNGQTSAKSTPDSDDQAPLVPDDACPVRIGRFEIRRALGRGGFGIVYLAYDPALCREVALKIPRADALADAECLARFQREARAAAALNHPHLVTVYEAGQLGPVCYITYAYCPGSNLAEWLKQRAVPVGCVQAARLLLILAQAIQYAHARGILHRDLKPSNVLLTPVPRAERSGAKTDSQAAAGGLWRPDSESPLLPRVTDFGLARLDAGDRSQTQSGAVLGTPCYMAPEQADGRAADVGPATDVYALGTILYEVLTGRPLFWAATPLAVLWHVKMEEPVRPGRLRHQLPRDLETICLRCLHKEPRQRYGSAEALAEDLRRFLAGMPILARPTSTIEHVQKWTRRRPALSATLAALALVTALGVGGVFWQWMKTRDALADEARARLRAEMLQRQAQVAQYAEGQARRKSEVALYHHRVVLAHREWLAGNVGRASQLLEECPEDEQDWEWRYVRRLCDGDLCTLRGHEGAVTHAVFSPDGKMVASVGGDWYSDVPGEVKLWDAASGQLRWTGTGHSGPVMAVAFSPDGRQVASGCTSGAKGNGEVKIWETASGKELRTLSDMPGGAFGLAYSPDGSRLASGGVDFNVRLWDVAAGRQLAALAGHTGNVFSVDFSPDGRLLVSAGWDGKARIWDTASLQTKSILTGPADLRSVAFSPDGRRLVTASYDQTLKVWDASSGELTRTYWGHASAALCATFSPDGRWVASSDTAGNVHIWDPGTGRLLRAVRGHTGPVGCVAFSPEGRRMLTSGHDRTVRIWDFTREQESLQLEASGLARNVVFSPDSKLIAAAGYRHSSGRQVIKTVRVWSVDNPARPRSWSGHADWVTSVAFHPKGMLLASGSNDRTARLWDVATGKTVHKLEGHEQMVTGVSFSPDGSEMASSSLDKTVKRWDVATGRALGSALVHPHPVQDVVYLNDGRRLAAVGDQGMAQIWDVETGRVQHALRGHQETVFRAVVSLDGGLLATAGRDQAVCLWDMSNLPIATEEVEPIHIFMGSLKSERITGMAFSSDGRRLASSGLDHTIRLRDVVSGDETLSLRGHSDSVYGLAFSPDGRALASASARSVRIWETEKPGPGLLDRTPATEALDWHRRQSDECRSAEPVQWFGVLFHLNRLLEADPRDWRLRLRRADAEMELGRWQGAVDDYKRGIVAGASDPWAWYMQAVGQLHLGDREGYHEVCADMLARFGQGKDPVSANMTAWTCALAPAAVPDPDVAVGLALKATKAEPTRAGFHSTLGAVLYRVGRYDAARVSLLESLRLSKEEHPEDWLVLSMISHGLREQTEARVWLEKAVKWCDALDNGKPDRGDVSRGLLAEIQLLRREAEALLAGFPEDPFAAK